MSVSGAQSSLAPKELEIRKEVDPPRVKLAHALVAQRPEKPHRANAEVPAVGDGAPRGHLAISRSILQGNSGGGEGGGTTGF